jgi:chromosomal replication initiator protein
MWQQGNTAAMQTQITPALRAAQWSAQDTGAQPLGENVCPTTDKGADMNKNTKTFDRVMARLKAQVGPEVFTSWFGRLKLQSASKSVVRLSVPTAFLKSWINNKYLEQISALFSEEDPDILKVEIVVRSATRASRQAPETDTDAAANSSAAQPAPAQARKDLHLSVKGAGAHLSTFPKGPQAANTVIGSPLDPRYTFESYVEGSSNRVALAAAKTIAEAGTGAVRFNPLFIHSNVGLGKTHLCRRSPRRPAGMPAIRGWSI